MYSQVVLCSEPVCTVMAVVCSGPPVVVESTPQNHPVDIFLDSMILVQHYVESADKHQRNQDDDFVHPKTKIATPSCDTVTSHGVTV